MMHLLGVPDEILLSIALWLWEPPKFHTEDDWRSGREDVSLDPRDFRNTYSEIHSLAQLNRRCRRVLLPLHLRTLFLSTSKKLHFIDKCLLDDENLGKSIRFLLIRRDCARKHASAIVTEVVSHLIRLTTLYVIDKMPVDQPFFLALSRCKSLKSLHLRCSGRSNIGSHVPELKELRLQKVFIEISRMSLPLLDIGTDSPCLPLQDLLSGASIHTLEHLTLKTAEYLPWTSESDQQEPLLRNFIPDDLIYESVEVLKLIGIEATAHSPQILSRQFPKLFTLLIRRPPVLVEQPAQKILPSLTRLSISQLSRTVAVSVFAPSVEELEVGSDLRGVAYPLLCSDLRVQSLPCLRTLSIHIMDISATGEEAHALSLLFSNVPLLEKFKIAASRFPRQPWDTCLESFVAAFSLIPHLKTLVWNASIDPVKWSQVHDLYASTPDEDEWFEVHEPTVETIAQRLSDICPNLASVFWLITTDVGYWRVTSKNGSAQPHSFQCDNTQFWENLDAKFWNEDL